MGPPEVIHFKGDISPLKEALLKHDIIKDQQSFDNPHFKYFSEYFSNIGVQSIIIEYDYIDKDYLDDYSNYYSRCYAQYGRYCARLHLFPQIINKEKFFNSLCSNKSTYRDSILNSYSGFIVIKPIPKTIIGRTCIQTNEPDNAKQLPLRKEYKVNLFGTKCSVNSLAFQEQDSIVAACATSSLWSAFHLTSSKFGHSIPTPYEITKAATHLFPFADRRFPNKGLSGEQMAHAIKNIGLESIVVNPENESIFKACIYAYLNGGLPIILGIQLYNINGDKYTQVGYHTVLINGIKQEGTLNGIKLPKSSKTALLLTTSERINEIYVHDDQIGPFAVMVIDNMRTDYDKKSISHDNKVRGRDAFSLSTRWHEFYPEKYINVRAIPDILIVPAYHKIRVSWDTILDSINFLNNHLQTMKLGENKIINYNLEWSIKLNTIDNFKEQIKNSSLEPERKKEILFKSSPKYIWQVTGKDDKNGSMDLIFDATDIEHGRLLFDCIHYGTFWPGVFKRLASHKNYGQETSDKHALEVIQWHASE
jgi:hypothetical protein